MMAHVVFERAQNMSVATTDDLLDKLSDCLMVDRNKLSLETKAEDIDIWDSMGVVEIVFMLQREYGVSLSPDDAYKITSVQAVVDILRDAGKLA